MIKTFSRYTAIRTVIQKVDTAQIQLVDAVGRDEDFTQKELFQHYGFCSRPLKDAEGVLLFLGGVDNAIVIATEDRRYRLTLDKGEVGLYTDEGDKIHLKRNREIEITAGTKVTVTAPTCIVNASTKCQVISPEIDLGDVLAQVRRLMDSRLRDWILTHTHEDVEPGAGTSGVPTQAMDLNDVATNITRAK